MTVSAAADPAASPRKRAPAPTAPPPLPPPPAQPRPPAWRRTLLRTAVPRPPWSTDAGPSCQGPPTRHAAAGGRRGGGGGACPGSGGWGREEAAAAAEWRRSSNSKSAPTRSTSPCRRGRPSRAIPHCSPAAPRRSQCRVGRPRCCWVKGGAATRWGVRQENASGRGSCRWVAHLVGGGRLLPLHPPLRRRLRPRLLLGHSER